MTLYKMAGMNLTKKPIEEIRRDVERLAPWYQCFELPGGVLTCNDSPGSYRPEARWQLIEPFIPADLSGKTVLDVGGNAGYLSVQMMKRGAQCCTLVEPFVEIAAQARYVADLFQFDIRVVTEDVHTWCLTTQDRFDYVLFVGLFYHLKYPGLVLDRLAEMTRARLYFNSHAVGNEQPVCEVSRDLKARDEALDGPAYPRMLFLEDFYNGDPGNWWIPSASLLEPLVRSAGMKVIARPNAEMVIAEPDRPLGKFVQGNLVFPCYAKRGRASIYPNRAMSVNNPPL